jgi:hypothetical protein
MSNYRAQGGKGKAKQGIAQKPSVALVVQGESDQDRNLFIANKGFAINSQPNSEEGIGLPLR